MSSATCPPEPCEGNALTNLSKRLQNSCPAYPGAKKCAPGGAEAPADETIAPTGAEASIGAGIGAGTSVESSDLDISNKANHIKRTVLARITTSLARAEADASTAVWTMPLSHHKHLKRVETDDLSKAVLLDVVVKNVRSTAPVALATHITNVTGTAICPSGLTALIVHPHSNTKMKRSIYTPDESIFSKKIQQYAGISEEALRMDVLPKPRENWSYVQIGTPIADIVIKNQKLLEVHLDESFVMDQQLKVDNDLVDKCIAKLLSIAESLPFTPLDNFTVKFTRFDGESFGSATGVESLGPNGVVKHSLRTDPFVVEVELELTYVLVSQAA